MRNKAQTAMEYLMTYGWAILIVIVVIAALYSMGVFTLTGGVPCSPCFSYFSYIDHDSTNLYIRNGPRVIESVSIAGTSVGDVYNASDDLSGAHSCTSWPCDVTVAYTVSDSGALHSDTGTLQSPT